MSVLLEVYCTMSVLLVLILCLGSPVVELRDRFFKPRMGSCTESTKHKSLHSRCKEPWDIKQNKLSFLPGVWRHCRSFQSWQHPAHLPDPVVENHSGLAVQPNNTSIKFYSGPLSKVSCYGRTGQAIVHARCGDAGSLDYKLCGLLAATSSGAFCFLCLVVCNGTRSLCNVKEFVSVQNHCMFCFTFLWFIKLSFYYSFITLVTVLYVPLYHDHFHKLPWFNFFFVRVNSKGRGWVNFTRF